MSTFINVMLRALVCGIIRPLGGPQHYDHQSYHSQISLPSHGMIAKLIPAEGHDIMTTNHKSYARAELEQS